MLKRRIRMSSILVFVLIHADYISKYGVLKVNTSREEKRQANHKTKSAVANLSPYTLQYMYSKLEMKYRKGHQESSKHLMSSYSLDERSQTQQNLPFWRFSAKVQATKPKSILKYLKQICELQLWAVV